MDVSGVGRRARDRFPAALLALCLQVLLLAALILSLQQTATQKRILRETILVLPRLAPPQAAPRFIDARDKPRRLIAPLPVVPSPQSAGPAAAPERPDVRSLGKSLFGCAPEVYADLPPEQRAACARPGEGVAMNEAPNLMGGRSHVKDEAHWAEEYARAQSPTILPCLGGLDIMCLLTKLADGSIKHMADPRTWPRYEVEQIPPEDFYKIEQAYDAWHKAHPESPLAPAQ